MPFELPLFPLNVVLFPGMPLPLHIFEPRYRLMIGRCLEGDRTFGVAQMIDGEEGFPGTTATNIGTVAEIIEVAPFADGRMNLQTIGTRRFHILSTREQDEYLIAACEWLEDEPEEDGISSIADRTRRVLSRYFDSLALNTQLSTELGDLDVPQDPYSLSMFIAAIMALPSEQKQRLLAMTSTQERLELEEFLLDRADLVQRAYAKHAAHGFLQAPGDTQLGQFSNFLSLN
ncbi:MAG TPA: LON peptidase substrate-binding domain-containing protein [Abditibacterium sp.]|jgi:Lon protease-like protein